MHIQESVERRNSDGEDVWGGEGWEGGGRKTKVPLCQRGDDCMLAVDWINAATCGHCEQPGQAFPMTPLYS
jgi:hypothetical protein